MQASSNSVQGPHSSNTVSPELEQTLSMLSSHRSVLGYMLVTRGHHPSIIRHSGVVFEGEQGKRYAAVVARIVESVQSGLEEIRGDDGLGAVTGDAELVGTAFVCSPVYVSLTCRLKDEVRFMRIRTKRHEIMISPGMILVYRRHYAHLKASCRRQISSRCTPRSCYHIICDITSPNFLSLCYACSILHIVKRREKIRIHSV